MDLQHAPIILKEIRKYLSLSMFDSAEQLSNFYLSALSRQTNETENNANNIKSSGRETYHLCVADIYELIADIAYQKKEVRRALNYYRLAIQQKKLLSNNALNSGNQPRIQVSIVMNEQDAKLRYKECKCQAELKDTASALRDLESIPAKYRDLAVLTLMGNLYNESNLKRHAVASFKEALMLSPLSTEIIQQLVSAGCESAEIIEAVNESMKANPELIPIITQEKWLPTFIMALYQKKNYDTEKSYTNLLTLNGFFPKNPLIMSLIALNAMDAEQSDNAIASFKKIRQMDSTVVEYMDTYAKLLFQKKEELELNRLANDLIENNPLKPQGYLIASWYCFLKNDPENAMSFVEKVEIFRFAFNGFSFLFNNFCFLSFPKPFFSLNIGLDDQSKIS
jgi:predicted Zn-dependent protease